MTDDDVIEGPDPNRVRRHAKKMLTELEYRKKYRKIDYYKPNRAQLELHNAGEDIREINLRAANQFGKSLGSMAQLTFDSTADYPMWYKGRKFLTPPKITRPYNFQSVIASNTSTVLRDGLQARLMGDLGQHDGLGTGMLPLDCIVGKPTMSRGISGYMDTVIVSRAVGGQASISTRTYDADRRSFQGITLDSIHLDEDDPHLSAIYGEVWARLSTTRGKIAFTATAMLGATAAQKRFQEEGHPERLTIVASLADADHISEKDRQDIIKGYREDEVAARAFGAIKMGVGAVFRFDRKQILHTLSLDQIPQYARWIWGVDFSHAEGPTSHPFAGCLLAWNSESDIVYVMESFKLRGAPAVHAARIKAHPCFDAICAWPRDGAIHSLNSGTTIIGSYKKLGLNCLPKHATWPDGSVSMEAGIFKLQERLDSGKIKVASHLNGLLIELENYHRDEDGKIAPHDDDEISALRTAIMSLRYAKPLEDTEPNGRRGYDPAAPTRGGRRVNTGIVEDLDPWCPGG